MFILNLLHGPASRLIYLFSVTLQTDAPPSTKVSTEILNIHIIPSYNNPGRTAQCNLGHLPPSLSFSSASAQRESDLAAAAISVIRTPKERANPLSSLLLYLTFVLPRIIISQGTREMAKAESPKAQ